MNIEHKKTTLGDDSILYQKRDDSLGKKDISNLSRAEKMIYFKDYYLKIVIVAAIIIIGIGHLVYTTTIGRSISLASLVFIDESYLYDTGALCDTLKEYLGSERKQDYVSASNFNLENYQENMAFVTQLTTGTIDLIICPEEYFEQGCKIGYFMDLSQYLPEEMFSALEDRILEGSYAVKDEEGEVISYEDPLPHGISLKDTARYIEFGGMLEDSVLCVSGNSENPVNTLKVLSWLTDVPVPESALNELEAAQAE